MVPTSYPVSIKLTTAPGRVCADLAIPCTVLYCPDCCTVKLVQNLGPSGDDALFTASEDRVLHRVAIAMFGVPWVRRMALFADHSSAEEKAVCTTVG